jgi:hypothetical protein
MANNQYFDSEQEAIKILKQEVKKLNTIAKNVWRSYLDSYSPQEYNYKRTGNSLSSIRIGELIKINGETLGIAVTFDDDLAFHKSYINKKTGRPKGHAIMLISQGWRVKKGWHRKIYRFGYYEGFDYLGKVMDAYNAIKHPYIDLEIQWQGHKIGRSSKPSGVIR